MLVGFSRDSSVLSSTPQARVARKLPRGGCFKTGAVKGIGITRRLWGP